MPTTAVRRADFLMVLAYATDLATGQSRDFALRACVLSLDGQECLEESLAGPAGEAARIGRDLALKLVARGAKRLIDSARAAG